MPSHDDHSHHAGEHHHSPLVTSAHATLHFLIGCIIGAAAGHAAPTPERTMTPVRHKIRALVGEAAIREHSGSYQGPNYRCRCSGSHKESDRPHYFTDTVSCIVPGRIEKSFYLP